MIEAKGADAMIPLALALRCRGIEFTLDIYGSGELSAKIQRAIESHNLSGIVRLHGPVDFDTVFIPTLKREVDLFVCCHRQGDPSCTYAETLGCGVPIVGFSNESLSSLIESHTIGWQVRMNDLDALTTLIASLDSGRQQIAVKSRAALEFAQKFNFEQVFEERALHCVTLRNANVLEPRQRLEAPVSGVGHGTEGEPSS